MVRVDHWYRLVCMAPTRRVPLEAHEDAWSTIYTIVQRELSELGVMMEGEICCIEIRPTSIRVEAEILAPDDTWLQTNLYQRRFNY